MTNLNSIENQISVIKKYLKLLAYYREIDQKKISRDPHLKGGLERYLYLVTQSTIDLAESMISFKGFRKPTTLVEPFEILLEEGVIESKLAEKLIKMVGFRNIIAHNYTELNYEIVFDVLNHRLKDIEEFLVAVGKII